MVGLHPETQFAILLTQPVSKSYLFSRPLVAHVDMDGTFWTLRSYY